MRGLAPFILCVLGTGCAAAQSPFTWSSTMETGWTSSASEHPGGAADNFVHSVEAVSMQGNLGPMRLRAGLTLDQTRYIATPLEDDVSIEGGIEAGLNLGGGLSLRLGYAMTRSLTGSQVDLGQGIILGILNPLTEHEVLAEVQVDRSDRQAVLGVDGLMAMPGPARFSGAPLPPIRLDPQVQMIIVRADGELAVAEDLAVLGRLHGMFVDVPASDQLDYAREPADALRVAGGLRWRHDATTIEGRAGLDAVRPDNAPQLVRASPYLDLGLRLQIRDDVTVEASLRRAVELRAPLDDVASAKQSGELSMRWAITDALTLSAGLGIESEAGLYDRTLETSRKWMRLGVDFTPHARTRLGLNVDMARVNGLDGPYDRNRVTLAAALQL